MGENTKSPGFDCPECGARVGVTLQTLAHESTKTCPNCFANVSLDRDEVRMQIIRSMKAAIEGMMDETRAAVEKMNRLKRG